MHRLLADHAERLAVIAGVGVLLAAAEWANPSPSTSPRDRAETRRHLAWLAAFFVVGPAVGWVVSRAIAITIVHTPLREPVGSTPFAVRAMLAIAAGETVAYWLHRWMHASRRLWRVHAIHHRATDVRWWTAFRAHPLSGLLVHVAPFTAAAATGAGSPAVGAYVGTVFVITVLAHADVYVPWRWLDRVVVTPAFHRAHHRPGGDRHHYAQILPLLDALFGTARQPTSTRPMASEATLAVPEATAPVRWS